MSKPPTTLHSLSKTFVTDTHDLQSNMGYTQPITNWTSYPEQGTGYQGSMPMAPQQPVSAMPLHATPLYPQAGAGLDPWLPAFEPTGLDLQHYQAPDSCANSAVANMQRQFVDMNVSHASDFVKFGRRTDQIAREMEDTREICQNDLQYLHRKVIELEKKVSASSSTARNLRKKDHYFPPREMLEQFSKKSIAEAFIDEADEMVEIANKLRQQAEAMHPGMQQLLQALPAPQPDPPSLPAYACCQTVFADLLEMLKHVDTEHTRHDSAHGSTDRGRSKSFAARPHAIEIKTPESSKAAPPINAEAEESSNAQGTITTPASLWQPYAIRNLAPLPDVIPAHEKTFTWDFLQSTLQGNMWSPGFFYVSGQPSMLPAKAYWILEVDNEPFLPASPGKHGAKLTAFFNGTLVGEGMGPTEENYMNTPIFVRERGARDYRYYGQYSQLRYSDKVSYDTLMEHVPEKVRAALAEELTESGRPRWVTDALRKAILPRPEYEGQIPTDSACNTPETTEAASSSTCVALEHGVRTDLEEYAVQLKEHEKDSRRKVKMLTKENIMEAFEKEDAAEPPGLRLWWEYLQCIDYDAGFYNMLVTISELPHVKKSGGKSSIRRPPTPRLADNASTDIKKGVASLTKKGKVVRNDQGEKDASATAYPSPALALKPTTTAESIMSPKAPPATFKLRKPIPLEVKKKPYEGIHPGIHVDDMKPTVWTEPDFNSVFKHEIQAPRSQRPSAPQKVEAEEEKTKKQKPASVLPPHLRGKAPAPTPDAPAAATEIDQGDEPKNPFANGDLKAAKAFSKEATPAQPKALSARGSPFKPPHLRRTGK